MEDNIFYKGLKNQKNRLYKDEYILKGYQEQFSPACGAAVVAGSINGLLKIENTDNRSLKIKDILNIYSNYFKKNLDENKEKLELYTGGNFDKLLILIKKILKKKKIYFGTKKAKKIVLYLTLTSLLPSL